MVARFDAPSPQTSLALSRRPRISLLQEDTMCHRCADPTAIRSMSVPRRDFLAWGGAAMASLALARDGFAAPPKAPPKKENILSPDAALKRLMMGNERYVEGVSKRHDFKHEREALSKGQNPFAGILSCADSRVAPEYAFDTARGDLFVCRVAGNFLNTDVVASFEYAVSVLHTPLLMVLGHESCGAVDAAITSIRDGTTLPGHLPSLVEAIGPAVKDTQGKPGDALANAIKQNVLLNVEKLKTATPIVEMFVSEKKVRVVGAIYNLEDGSIDLVG
jgi:carbonic anhydrase